MASDERMQVGLEELQDLKGVWSELAKIWEKVDELKEKPWLSVQPRKVGEVVSRGALAGFVLLEGFGITLDNNDQNQPTFP